MRVWCLRTVHNLHTAHGRLVYLSPAAKPTWTFLSPFFSLVPSLSFPDPQEREKGAESYVSPAYISFSLPPSIFQTACVACGLVWVWGDADRQGGRQGSGDLLLGLGYSLHLARQGPRLRCVSRTAAMGGGDRRVKFSSPEQLVLGRPRCSAVSRCSK